MSAEQDQRFDQIAAQVAETLSGCNFAGDADDGVAYIKRAVLSALSAHPDTGKEDGERARAWLAKRACCNGDDCACHGITNFEQMMGEELSYRAAQSAPNKSQ
jgi:hypothetical protein